MKRTPLQKLRTWRQAIFSHADHTLGRAFAEVDRAYPCSCGRDHGHRDDCPRGKAHRLASDLFDAAERYGRIRERLRVAERVNARSGPTGAGLVYRSALQLVANMRWPR